MPKVIKGNQLLIDQPRLLELIPAEDYNINTVQEPVMDPAILEREQLDVLKLEAKRVWDETQEMVMELLQKARDEARSIIVSAESEAELLHQQAAEEAKLLMEGAKNNGYEEGLKKAQEDIEADRQLAIEQSRTILEEARKTKLEMFRSSESDIVRLAMAVAKKVVCHELSVNPEVVINVIREAVSFLDQADDLMIYVNPDDLDQAVNGVNTEHLFDVSNKSVAVQVLPDKRISRGGTIIESNLGTVDARMDIRTSNVEQCIQEVLTDG